MKHDLASVFKRPFFAPRNATAQLDAQTATPGFLLEGDLNQQREITMMRGRGEQQKAAEARNARNKDGISAVFAATGASLLAPSRLLSGLAVSEVSNAGAGTASKHSAGREPAIRSQVKPSLGEIVKNRIATGQLSRNELLGHMRRRVQR
ncbi:MAG: hypothetical protein CBE03_004280 [Gammaproteobacteria bacterium TMED243]|nr:hypothetical protein [Gammaproteobacteria bacterium]RPG32540.1 MAG: hypothetical protein CBE03_004280 [Gammaproteobacteria bacterium TMED243]